MLTKKIVIFFTFLAAHSIFQLYNFWMTKNGSTQEIWGMKFNSIYTFWIVGLLIFTPILSVANIFFSWSFYYGKMVTNQFWQILYLFVFAQVISYPLMAYLVLKEIPSTGNIAGAFFVIIGIIVSTIYG